MALLTKQTVDQDGLIATFAGAGAGGDTLQPGERAFLAVINASAGALTVEVDDPKSVAPRGAQTFDPDVQISVPAGGRAFIGPLVAQRFRANADGLVHVSYPGGVASLTVAALELDER